MGGALRLERCWSFDARRAAAATAAALLVLLVVFVEVEGMVVVGAGRTAGVAPPGCS